MSKYTNIMENNINDKRVLLQFVDWSMPVIDVGCSTGALTFELASEAKRNKQCVFSVEPDKATYDVLARNVETFSNVKAINDTLENYIKSIKQPCNLVLSSVMHHMLRYRQDKDELFNRLFEGLVKGSRVIIRDGCRPSRHRAQEVIGFQCTPYSLELAKEFLSKFRSWKIPKKNEWILWENTNFTIDGCTVWAERWLIVEMLLTITWGKESMERECDEHYTILGYEDYLDWFNEQWETLYCECIVQEGYMEYLPRLGKLINNSGWQIPLPFTNQILLFEKK